MLEGARDVLPVSTSVDWTFKNCIGRIYSPDFVVVNVELCQSPCDMHPVATSAGLGADKDCTSTVDSPDIAGGSADVFESTSDLIPASLRLL